MNISDRTQKPINNSTEYDAEELIFALDIGTRTVVGIVGVQEEDILRVISAEVVEHKSRAMLDGQIHDINKVAEVVGEIKSRLEKNIGIKLKKVAVAAAGRVLRTCQINVEREVDPSTEIDRRVIGSLEIEGIQKAQLKLDKDTFGEQNPKYYCIGYSIINYYLNGYVISSLLGHKGTKIGADVLATFLPHVVVESLYTVMSRVGLEVMSLTLEPIAAINVAIPDDLRMLNLALIDIGAGTSDIAITKNGSVTAYAMVSIAGDEITEKISQHYLVDFNTAERIKTTLSSSRANVTFTDIIGKKHVIDCNSVIQVIADEVKLLAETISKEVMQYNHKAPNAVFLIGGGSQIPGLTKCIAENLNLQEERVAIRNRATIQNVRFRGKKLKGPEAITPFGIAVTAQMKNGQDFLAVTVNGKKVRLFNSKKMAVSDALILVGFNPGDLIGRTGKGVVFTINGEKRTIRGDHGKAAEIFVNGASASIDTAIAPGDDISITPAVNGKPAEVAINSIVKSMNADDNISEITVNGESVSGDYILKNGDNVELKTSTQKHSESDTEDEKINMKSNEAQDGCQNIVKDYKNKDSVSKKTEIEEGVNSNSIFVTVNGEDVELKGNKKQYIFVDVFNYVSFDLTKPKGNIVLRLNGEQAAFTDVIRSGDCIDIFWNK